MRKLGLILAVMFITGSAVGGAAGSCGLSVAGESTESANPTGRLGQTPDLHFEPHGLYGHINGGSELFLEFGFEGLDVHHVADDLAGETGKIEEAIDVEIYHMSNPAAALGIYLAKCGRENPMAGVVARNTGGPFQITAVAGSLFLQVNNFSGETSSLPTMVELANEVLAPHGGGEPLPIWQHLPQPERILGTEFLFRGQYALDPVFTFGEGDILQLADRALGAGARYDNGDGVIYRRMTVVYENRQTAKDAFIHLRANLDSYIAVVESTELGLVFKDYAGRYGLIRVVDERLDITIDLAKAPLLGEVDSRN